MKSFVVRISFCIICISITSCSLLTGKGRIFENHGNDYLKTGSIDKIVLPEGVQSTNLTPIYMIPDVAVSDEFGDSYTVLEYEIPPPKAISIDKNSAGVKLQRLNTERWIYIKAAPSQIWPRTQNFLSEYNLLVAKSDAVSGIIETDWITFRDDESTRSRYRIALEKGIHPETTEIHVLHIQRPSDEIDDAPIVWPAVSNNKVREDWLVENLSQDLAKNVGNSSASLLGANVGGELKAGFDKKGIEPRIRITLHHDRVWATLSHSARMEGFHTWESSEELGVIYLDHNKDLVKKRGFWRKLAFWNRPKVIPEKAANSLDQVLMHLSPKVRSDPVFANMKGLGYGSALADAEGFLLIVTREDDTSYVVIRDSRGRLLSPDEAKYKLRILRKNLI